LLIKGGVKLPRSRREYIQNASLFSLSNTNDFNSDFTTQMSTLSLNKAQSLQQEKEAQSQRPLYNAPAPTELPLTAPQPKRTTAAPQVWMPGMEIKFAPPGGDAGGQNGAGAQGQQGKSGGGGTWDPSKGMRFG